MNKPLVSIVIPTYKRADGRLSKSIDSVLDQSYSNVEVVVVDDNNPDTDFRKATQEIMQKYAANDKVKYIQHEKNKNGAAARNTGIQNSSGSYIGFLDDDDFFYPKKIEKQVSFLLKNKEYAAVYSGVKFPNGDYNSTSVGDLSYELLSGDSLVYTITILIQKEAILASGGWDESFRRHQEAAMLLRVFKLGYKIGVVNEILSEVDIEDRSNALSPKENEKEVRFYLAKHTDNIASFPRRTQKAIISKRLLGVFLCYLKNRHYVQASLVFLELCYSMPLQLMKTIFYYIKHR